MGYKNNALKPSICFFNKPNFLHSPLTQVLFTSFWLFNCTTVAPSPSESDKPKILLRYIEKEKEIDWRDFFRPPPTSEDKSQLEKNITQWDQSSDIKSLLAKARAEIAIGHYKNAESSLLNIIRRDQDNVETYLELINFYLKVERVSDASDTMNILEEKLSSKAAISSNISREISIKIKFLKSMLLLALESRTEGRKILSEMIGEIPTFSPAYVALSQSYINGNNLKLAEFVITRGLDRIKDDPELFNSAGIIAVLQRDFEKANEMFDNALLLNGKYPPALINRANLQIQNGQLSSAEEELSQVSIIDPLNPDALVSRGNLYLKQGNFDGAQKSYLHALDLKPSHAFARFNLAILYLKHLNNPSDAKQYLNEVVQLAGSPNFMKEEAQKHLKRLSANN
jgi:tetratricopeptide (TPR) repeat protein